MKTFLLLAGICGAGFLFGPQFMEGANSSCHALESHIRTTQAYQDEIDSNPFGFLGDAIVGMSNGNFATQAAKDANPNLPPSVTCAVRYWEMQAGG